MNSGPNIAYRAPFALAENGIIENALLTVSADSIDYIGAFENSQIDLSDYQLTELDDSVLIPGLINAHTHTNFPDNTELEFDNGSMIDWVRAAMQTRANRTDSDQQNDSAKSLARLQATGTVALAEISNDLQSLAPIANSGMPCRYFYECFGFPTSFAERVMAELQDDLSKAKVILENTTANQTTIHSAPHAPYSTGAELIQRLTERQSLSAIHIAENLEEVELLQTGQGPWRERLREIDRDEPNWSAPNCSPIAYLEKLGVLRENLLLIHCIHISSADIALIKSSDASVVLCPGSNRFIGTGFAPALELLKAEIPLALGTDSLGSNTDLNLFAEMRELKRQAPEFPYQRLWELATTGGAKALGYQDSLGKLRVNTAPGIYAARLDIKSPAELFEALIHSGDQKLTQLHSAKLNATNY